MQPRINPLFDIRAFADQDRDRGVVTRAARRTAAEIILRMDLVTSPGGLDELTRPDSPVPPEAAAQYLEFRRWFASFLAAELQAFAGRVLQATSVYEDGRAVVYEKRMGRPPPTDMLTTFAARLNWLVSEIPSLHEAYGQLLPAEVPTTIALCERVDALDLGDAAQLAEAQEAWPTLEMFYIFAQPGARILRGDHEALTAAKAILERLAVEVEEEEAVLRARIAVAAGARAAQSPEETAEALRYVVDELAENDARVQRLSDAARQAAARRAELEGQRTRLIAATRAA